MAGEIVNIGSSANDSTGDPLRTAFSKINTRFSEAVSVTDYGAVGDGVTDDTASINLALAVGGVIHFPPGTYKYTGGSPVSDSALFGYGATINLSGTTNGFTLNGVSRVAILGLRFTNTTPSTSESIKLTGANADILLADLTGEGLYQFGVEVSGTFNRLAMRNIKMLNHGRAAVGTSNGIEINPTGTSYDLWVDDCYVEMPSANGGNCAKFQNVTRGHVKGCTFSRGSGGSPSASQAVMFGTVGKPLSQFTVSGNTIIDATTAYGAAYLGGSSADVTWANNQLKGAAGHLYLGTLTDVEITGGCAGGIYSLGTPNLTDVLIGGGIRLEELDFTGSVPVDVSGLKIIAASVSSLFKVKASGTCSGNAVAGNTIDTGSAKEHFWYLPNCVYSDNTLLCTGSAGGATNHVIANGSGIVIARNTFETNSNRAYSLYANGLTGRVIRNSFYGYTSAYKTDSGGAPVYCENLDSGVIDSDKTTSFTPTVTGSGTAGTGTYTGTGQHGRYSLNGNRIDFTIALAWTAHTGAGNLEVSGLPVAAINQTGLATAVVVMSHNIGPGTGKQIQAYIGSNATKISLWAADDVGGAGAAVALDTAGELYISGSYFIA